MAILSAGKLNCTPVQVTCKKTLDEIAAGLQSQLYAGNIPTTGWGSIIDDVSYLVRDARARPTPGFPEISPPTASIPHRRLKARYYWDAADPAIIQVIGNSDKLRTHRLVAVDLVLAETDDPGIYRGAITTRADREMPAASKGVRESFAQIEPASMVQFDSIDFTFPREFYLWLLHRRDIAPRLDNDLTLEVVRSLRTKDTLSRPTSLASGADIDRAELAAAVFGNPRELGPAQFAIQDIAIDLSLEIELHQDGSFQIIVGESDYDERLPRNTKGERLVDDALFVVLPKLRSAFTTDLRWPNPGYAQLRSRTRAVLIALLDDPLSAELSIVGPADFNTASDGEAS